MRSCLGLSILSVDRETEGKRGRSRGQEAQSWVRKREEGAPKTRLNAGVGPACACAGFFGVPFARGPSVVGLLNGGISWEGLRQQSWAS